MDHLRVAFTLSPLKATMACRVLFVSHVIVAVMVSRTSSAPIPSSSSSSPSSVAKAVDYFVQFGYLPAQDPTTGALLSEEYVRNATRKFQRRWGLSETGELDEATKQMMDMPRCGNSDNIELGNGARKRRYALQGSKWDKADLTFKISVYPGELTQYEVDDVIRKALQVWGDVTPLTFTSTEDGKADLDVQFVRRSHGDGNPFDGRGRTLAHAFFPQWGGDAHFDAEEAWTIEKSSGVSLFQVAAHEFGHSLGLSHSDSSDALMAPFYRGYQRDFKLDDDDVRAVQELYGSPPVPPPREEGPGRGRGGGETGPNDRDRGPRVSVPPICSDPRVDAIVMNADGQTYIFRGTDYYRLNDYGVDDDFPRKIEDDWGIPGPIDSALHWDNGYTFLFKGPHYWKFYNLNLIYQRRISEGFKGVPEDVDAAFVWGGNGKTYFIKGDQYWRYTENSVDRGYPRPLTVWSGLPSHIDAAIKWKNGRTYFFSGSSYYRYNDVEFNIDKTYPRKIGNWWLGCPQDKLSQQQILPSGAGSSPDTTAKSQELLQLLTDNATERAPGFALNVKSGSPSLAARLLPGRLELILAVVLCVLIQKIYIYIRVWR